MRKFTEALQTECQTEGAVYEINITPDIISVSITLPNQLLLTEEDGITLEANIHNAMELVMIPYFKK